MNKMLSLLSCFGSSMEDQYIHVLFFIVLILLSLDCTALDTIYANQDIKDGKATLVSEGETFELGFFSPEKSKHRYLGIWYKKISYGTVVWVANREQPITDTSGMLKLSRHGNLVIRSGGNPMVWSSKSMGNNTVLVAQLLDTGNFVVWNKNKMIWQSFDYPGDTFLPGMKIGKDLVTGLQRCLTSWKSPDDPSMGEYRNIHDTNGYPQNLWWYGEILRGRLGPWNGLAFSGFPISKEDPIYSSDFVMNEKEIYITYELKKSTVFQRVVLTWDGKTLILQWIERIKDWMVYANAEVDTCDRFSLCGPYGICSINKHPPCSCMDGFEPRNPEEWEASDWGSGCIRKKPLHCGNGSGDRDEDGFWKIERVKVPDTRRSWYNVSMTLGECEIACKRNCSCTGYTSLDIRNGGSGCLLWLDELLDTREYDANQDIYIRMAASELEGIFDSLSNSNKKKRILIVVLLTSTTVLLLFAVAYACRKIKKIPHIKGQGNWYALDTKNTSLQIDQLDELQCYSLYEVTRATGNFKVSNKIGQGGFGPVYKGVLNDGREIAVKRLSETSQQGFDEFKNEVICIAKLQHRNLVKLLGYCAHQNELILIYEYMPNRSLDCFLFDEPGSLVLNWPQRFNIIHGIARGILYLHQDSRLQIIHRDLKASNILLDGDMNPKISDFGLARNFVGHDTTAKTKKVVGTHGYIPPEYAVHGRFSIKSDVFSFGVLMLEIISGKRNREFSHGNRSDNLLGHAWRLYKDGSSIGLLSASLQASCVVSEVLRSIHIALLCVQHHPKDRPTMWSVVLMLVSEGPLPIPKSPAFFTEESCSELESIPSVDEDTITLLYAR
ncbi:G-type lectin S-receptor-like serine/threonine-protein kinase At4g27290 isoform X1 [Helianthus annuus]|uniref:Receptor-like serine/threonine-protein kinase n=1 Tax=Helianthus annuus TaxID=4232 RepID=A0A251S5S5_HELAN|nr:G-type lectin S-receptor-like serine/threonine-protein kinase At4g27290 isoform X1 [Helianthus annuus]